MLRLLALALLLANAGYFAWGQGLLAAYGLKPARQAEPERLAQQIRPEALQLVAPAMPAVPIALVAPQPVTIAAVETPRAPPADAACLQVGLFTERQAQVLRPRLRTGLAAGSWSMESSVESSRWIIYMGKYVSKDAMNRKRLKLVQLGLAFEPPASLLLNPGLSLGSFASRADAEDVLAQMAQRGLRSARVVLERPELPSFLLRLPVADAATRRQLDALKPQFADKPIQACP